MNDDSCRTRAISRRVPVFFTDVTGGKWGIICRHLVFVQQGANSRAPQSIPVAVCRVFCRFFLVFTRPLSSRSRASSMRASSFPARDIDRVGKRKGCRATRNFIVFRGESKLLMNYARENYPRNYLTSDVITQ